MFVCFRSKNKVEIKLHVILRIYWTHCISNMVLIIILFFFVVLLIRTDRATAGLFASKLVDYCGLSFSSSPLSISPSIKDSIIIIGSSFSLAYFKILIMSIDKSPFSTQVN